MKLGPKFKRAVLASTDPTKLPEDRPAQPALTEDVLEPGQQITIKHGEVWITVLGRDKDDETWNYRISDFRNAYMGKTGGLTPIPSKALSTRNADGYEDPVVEPEFQKRITQESRRKQQAALDDMFVALEELRSAVNTRLANNPEARKLMGRDAWALKSKIDAVERRLRRRHAA
jgi:hypothetical protein